MTLKIEKALQDSQRYTEQDSVFLQPGFRAALVQEFHLQAVDIAFTEQAEPTWLPAYKKQMLTGNQLIMGAGFEQTSETQALDQQTFIECIDMLSQQLQIHNINQLEIRSKHPIPCQRDHADKVELAIQLDMSCAERLRQFSKSTRRNLRLPFKHGFHYIIGNQQQQLHDFYQLYLISMHTLGSLPHSQRFFHDLWQNCRENILLFVGYMDNQPVAASFNFLHKNELYGAWGCAHPDYKKHCVFLAMLWLLLEHCEKQGLRTYNLGRTSVNTNNYQFKKRLANQESKIYHYRIDAYAPNSVRSPIYEAASWLIRHSPPAVMHTLARTLLHRFY